MLISPAVRLCGCLVPCSPLRPLAAAAANLQGLPLTVRAEPGRSPNVARLSTQAAISVPNYNTYYALPCLSLLVN